MTVDSNKDNTKSSSSSSTAALEPIEGLFKDVTYYIVGNISDEVQRILNAGGAKKDTYLSEMVSHVIADDVDNDEYSEARELFELPVVTSSWVLLSVKAERQLAKERFAPEDLVFSGVVACFTQVQEEDMKEIWAAIVYNGGYIQRKLDNHVTHLITAATSGLKYETAMKYPDKIKIVTPDWVTDSLSKKAKQDESIYHPRLIVHPEPEAVPPPNPTKTPEAEPMETIPTVVTPPLPSPLPHLGPQQQQQQPSMPAHFFEEKTQTHTAPVPTTRIELSTNKSSGSQRQTIAQILSQESQNRREVSNKDLLTRLVGSPTPTTASNLGINPGSILSTSPVNANNNATTTSTTNWENNNASQTVKPNGSQPGTPSAKLALARMVNSRLQAGANHHRATTPSSRATAGQGSVPRMPTPEQKLDATSPVLPATCTPNATPTTSNVLSPSRKTLQNITNSVDNGQPQVTQRPSMSKISQMLGLHVLPRTQSNGTSTVTPPSPCPSVTPQYWGHDPADKISPELPLLGCVFYITDYHKILGSDRITVWKQIIEQFGGQVDNSYSNRITHVLCASQQSDVFHLALRDQKRVVTAYWLNDVLVKKKMFPPCQVLHLPIIYGDKKPCNNQIIAMTNFDGEERERVKQMILSIGAKYTGYLTHCNSVLICKRPEGLKFEKAKEWRIPVVNTQWLIDLILADLDALRLPVPNKYLQLNQAEPFKMDLSKVSHLMVGWCSPLKITRDAWKRFTPALKKNISLNENLEDSGLKSFSSDVEGPVRKKPRLLGDAIPASSMTNPRVLFTGFGHSMVNKLRVMVEKLGGCVIDNPRQCTHLVAKSLSRTMKFFISINVCKYIITKEWLEDSIAKEKFLDEEAYALKDVEAEKVLQCDLTFSLQRARTRPLFKGFIFYITPSVVPAPKDLQSIIESAGGSVIKRRLSAKQIASLRDDKGNPTFIVITCPNDVHLCRDLMARRLAVFNSEFVLTGVLRQEIDFELFRLQVI